MAVGGNQMGPGGPGGDSYDPNKMDPVITKPFGSGYTGSGSQSGNQGNNVVTPQQELRNIVNQKSTLANQAGIPKYLTNKFKYLFPKGDVPYADMTGQQRAIADFYQGSTPNAYQQAIQNFMDASPENMDIYKKSGLKGAGLNAFMTTVPEALAERSLVGQGLKAFTGLADNVFDKLGTAYSAGKEKVGDMMDAGADILSPDTLGKPGDDFLNMSQAEYDAYRKNKLAQLPKDSIYDYGNIPDPMMSQRRPFSGFRDGIPSLLNTSTDTSNQDFRNKLFYQDLISGPNPLADLMTQNSNLSLSEINDLVGGLSGGASSGTPDFGYFANGGLASLNNRDYGMLMGASNFGF